MIEEDIKTITINTADIDDSIKFMSDEVSRQMTDLFMQIEKTNQRLDKLLAPKDKPEIKFNVLKVEASLEEPEKPKAAKKPDPKKPTPPPKQTAPKEELTPTQKMHDSGCTIEDFKDQGWTEEQLLDGDYAEMAVVIEQPKTNTVTPPQAMTHDKLNDEMVAKALVHKDNGDKVSAWLKDKFGVTGIRELPESKLQEFAAALKEL